MNKDYQFIPCRFVPYRAKTEKFTRHVFRYCE